MIILAPEHTPENVTYNYSLSTLILVAIDKSRHDETAYDTCYDFISGAFDRDRESRANDLSSIAREYEQLPRENYHIPAIAFCGVIASPPSTTWPYDNGPLHLIIYLTKTGRVVEYICTDDKTFIGDRKWTATMYPSGEDFIRRCVDDSSLFVNTDRSRHICLGFRGKNSSVGISVRVGRTMTDYLYNYENGDEDAPHYPPLSPERLNVVTTLCNICDHVYVDCKQVMNIGASVRWGTLVSGLIQLPTPYISPRPFYIPQSEEKSCTLLILNDVIASVIPIISKYAGFIDALRLITALPAANASGMRTYIKEMLRENEYALAVRSLQRLTLIPRPERYISTIHVNECHFIFCEDGTAVVDIDEYGYVRAICSPDMDACAHWKRVSGVTDDEYDEWKAIVERYPTPIPATREPLDGTLLVYRESLEMPSGVDRFPGDDDIPRLVRVSREDVYDAEKGMYMPRYIPGVYTTHDVDLYIMSEGRSWAYKIDRGMRNQTSWD